MSADTNVSFLVRSFKIKLFTIFDYSINILDYLRFNIYHVW